MRLPAALAALALLPLGTGAGCASRPAGPTWTLTGTVTAAHSGRALARADVRVGATEVRAQTDADGRFVLADVPAVPDTLLVMSQGYRWARIPLTGPDSFEVALDTTLIPLGEMLDEHQRAVGGESP